MHDNCYGFLTQRNKKSQKRINFVWPANLSQIWSLCNICRSCLFPISKIIIVLTLYVTLWCSSSLFSWQISDRFNYVNIFLKMPILILISGFVSHHYLPTMVIHPFKAQPAGHLPCVVQLTTWSNTTNIHLPC